MPAFFICIIVFVIWLHVKLNNENKTKDSWDMEFWQREHDAEFARKKDISDIEYILVDTNMLPFNPTPDKTEDEFQNAIKKLADKKLLNLSSMTNTDIKLEYGRANFEYLSECDQNYLLMLRTLNQWGNYIYNTLHDNKRAYTILEYAIKLGSDISETYITLAHIYIDNNEPEKIQNLIETIQATDSIMKDSIKSHLIKLIHEY